MTLSLENETSFVVDLEALEQEARFLLGALRLHPEVELSITMIDTDEMEALHIEWMQEAGATDILSFPMDELRPSDNPEPGMLGDIVICPQYVESDADRHGMDLPERIEFLLVHGILHLIGYDHATDEEYATMFALQDELLARWRVVRQGSDRG
jgi:probable rRNA maturation factor